MKTTLLEADIERSNQHELNGVGELQGILGKKRTIRAKFIRLSDDNVSQSDGELTWYDARESHESCKAYWTKSEEL